jgi:hypothetical protein
MNERRERRLVGAVGAFLLLVTAGALMWGGIGAFGRTPTAALQLVFLGAAGVCNVVAAARTPLTDRIPWYRWSGLGNVLLGASLPLGVIGPSGEPSLAVVTVGAGLALALVGIDLLAFHGRYTRGEPLGEP